MAVSTIKTTQMTWGFLNSRLNREPIDAASLNNSYTDLLWELNQTSSTYELGKSNTGGSSNFYVGLITSVPYVNKGHGQNEDSSLKGPWYVTYCGSDPNEGTGKYAFTGHIDDPINAANTYYADRIVLKRELDYALDKNTVSPLLLGTYYTGVGHWYDSYTKSKEYRDENKELPDGIYFPTTSYAEIFNDYTNNVATGKFSHAEGNRNTASGEVSHAEGMSTTASGNHSHAEGDSTTASGIVSHAEGNYTHANGNYGSHAEGNYTTAGGSESHAEGYYTTASGSKSHAEGNYTTASEYASHAEGNYTTAGGEASHAGGYYTTAGGNYGSHAEGYYTTASGEVSHAEGDSTTASGSRSHAEGNYTIAYNESEHAQGKYNVSDINNSGTLFTIGNGTSDNKRHNVVGIYHNGDINIEGQNTTNHNIGYFKSTIDGNYTQTIGTVGKNNTCNVTVNGTSDTRISGATYEGYDSTFISTTKDAKSTYSYSTTYAYSKGNVTNTTAGTRTVVTDGDVSVTNKANIYIATTGTHTENIDTTRSVVVGDHDNLVVNSNGRTEKITGEKITQVISGNINAYTDSTHDTRLNTRSAYLETVHAYIGDKTNTTIDGNYSVGLGQGIKVSSDTNVTVGKYNKDEASYFAVGIGTDDVNRKNAFWISQSNDAGSNGICYFSDNTYVYGNTYDPGQYPDNKEDKSWSPVVTYNMYRNSYECLYNIILDKLDIVDQYNSIMNRLKKLEEEVIWRSRIGVNGTNVLNKATYLWTGTLNEFNSLESKPADTTFIISN